MNLFLVRHGQTRANQQKVFQGWLDLALSAEGRKEAEWLRDRLRAEQLDQIYVSPLLRARETAEIICENRPHPLSLQTVDALKEMNFGQWEGLSAKEITAQTPEAFQNWMNDWQQFVIPGGESAANMFERVQNWIDPLVQAKPQSERVDQLQKEHSKLLQPDTRNILIVSHEGVILQIISHLLGLGLAGIWRFRVEPGSLSVLEIHDGFASLKALNLQQ